MLNVPSFSTKNVTCKFRITVTINDNKNFMNTLESKVNFDQ